MRLEFLQKTYLNTEISFGISFASSSETVRTEEDETPVSKAIATQAAIVRLAESRIGRRSNDSYLVSSDTFMSSHDCTFSIVRLLSNYKGSTYEINECEECGSLGLFAGAGGHRRVVLKGSAEFHDAVDLMEFLIRAIRN